MISKYNKNQIPLILLYMSKCYIYDNNIVLQTSIVWKMEGIMLRLVVY